MQVAKVSGSQFVVPKKSYINKVCLAWPSQEKLSAKRLSIINECDFYFELDDKVDSNKQSSW